MFFKGTSKKNAINTSGLLNSNNSKSETEHSSAPKKGFLLNFFDDDFSSNDSSQKSESNLEKLKSLFDIDSNHTINENSKNHSKTSDTTNDLGSIKSLNKTKYNGNVDNPISLNILSNPAFNEPNKPPQSFSLSNPEPLKYDNSFFPSKNSTDKQIEDLKMQMKAQQEQIQFLLQQQQQTPNFQYPINSNNFGPLNNNNVLNDKNIQKAQTENEISDNSLNLKLDTIKQEAKSSTSSKITSFDFSKGDTPSFCVKFNFGTGKQFTSKTNPSKPFLKCNFNNFSFSKSKSDNINKKGGFDYTDSFLFKAPREINRSNQNEKNILQIQDIKLYVFLSNDQNKKFFSTVGQGNILITENNNIYRIIVRNNKGNYILNTRIFPNISPKMNNKYVQIIGQNSGYSNDDYVDNGNDDTKDSDDAEKESMLSIYRIVFPTVEKTKEFFQCISLIK